MNAPQRPVTFGDDAVVARALLLWREIWGCNVLNLQSQTNWSIFVTSPAGTARADDDHREKAGLKTDPRRRNIVGRFCLECSPTERQNDLLGAFFSAKKRKNLRRTIAGKSHFNPLTHAARADFHQRARIFLSNLCQVRVLRSRVADSCPQLSFQSITREPDDAS